MSTFKIGDKVKVSNDPFWRTSPNDVLHIALGGLAGFEGIVESESDSVGDYFIEFPTGGLFISGECLTLVNPPKPVSPFTEEQVEFLRDLWWNEPAGTDAERILGELLKWRV